MRLMMDILAALATGLWQTTKALFLRLRGLLLAFMLVLNLGMIAVPMVYDMASRAFWGVVSIASASYALRAETRAARRASLDQIEADRDSARRRAAELDAEQVRLRRERDALDQRIRTAEANLHATRQRETSALKRLDSALKRLDEVELDRRRLTARAEARAAELAESREANRQVQNKVARTVQRMQGRSMQAVARNTWAASIETIPFLGTAVVIGAIVLDVWDTCQTLDDMHEIGRHMEFNSNDENEIETRWCGLKREEIWHALSGGPTDQEQVCIEARLRSRKIAPPECEGLEP